MEREVIWTPTHGPGLEHLRLTQQSRGAIADSLIVGLEGNQVFRLRYAIRCDPQWRVREARVAPLDAPDQGIVLLADGQGRWWDEGGAVIPALAGCIDVDLSASPFTNTLPIRRLALPPGASADLLVAYITLPELQLSPMRQRYTCLAAQADGSHYRYQSLDSGFTADLPVDGDGLVIDYPGLFRRVWSTA